MNTVFVAEVSSNHDRDLDRCLEFVDCAAEIGCDAVKFQLFKIDHLFAPVVLMSSAAHRDRRGWELPEAFLEPIARRCRERQILFGCTPFYLEAVGELLPFVDFLKIASYELLWHELIRECCTSAKPVVLSTGMATMEEAASAVTMARGILPMPDAADTDAPLPPFTLLHCVSGYPTPASECNLSAIATMRQAFGIPVGWSDHSVDPETVLRAASEWEAAMVEFHLDLDSTGAEYSAGHCWLPEEMREVIARVRALEQAGETGLRGRERCGADGTGEKVPATIEEPEREWRADPDDGLRPLKRKREELEKSA